MDILTVIKCNHAILSILNIFGISFYLVVVEMHRMGKSVHPNFLKIYQKIVDNLDTDKVDRSGTHTLKKNNAPNVPLQNMLFRFDLLFI